MEDVALMETALMEADFLQPGEAAVPTVPGSESVLHCDRSHSVLPFNRSHSEVVEE